MHEKRQKIKEMSICDQNLKSYEGKFWTLIWKVEQS